MHFRPFFDHIKSQFQKDEALIKEKHPEFAKVIEASMS